MLKKITHITGLLGVVLVAGAGCDGLGVENPNEPDRDRALSQPGDLEALIGGSFGVFFQGVHNEEQTVNLFPIVATEMTGVPNPGGGWGQGAEPRPAYENEPNIAIGSGPRGPRILWSLLSQAASNVHDGLRTIEDKKLVLTEGGRDVTPRARAFAKFMQGLSWGYMGMLYDKPIVVPETTPFQSDAIAQAKASIIPADQARKMALASLDEAISIAQKNTFTIPSVSTSRKWFGTPAAMSSTEFIQLANTMAARILVLSARNPQQRAQVDWNAVLRYTQGGLTRDFEVVLEQGFRTSLLLARAQTDAPGCESCFRLNNRLLGMADISGAYQRWLQTPIDNRTRFTIVTPDRRITGNTPTSDGAYVRYLAHDNGFPAARGLYRRSAYQWARHLHSGYQPNTGTAKLATVDENNLLRAEALLHLGDRKGAAELINRTRTRSHTAGGIRHPGLPPVTEAGVPQSPDCVPRTDAGACGDLAVALRYERMLELAALDAVRGYADSRGFGILPDGTWLQLPIPGNELEVLGMDVYTFGGVGTEWGAVYKPVTLSTLRGQ